MCDDEITVTDEQCRNWLAIPHPFGNCKKGSTRDLKHREIAGEHIVVRGGCNSWPCPICGPRKRYRFARHYAAKLLGDGRPVCERYVTRKEWDAFRKANQRGSGRYVRVVQACGWVVLYVTDRSSTDPQLTTPEMIYRRVGKLFRGMLPLAGQFSASDEWGMRRGPGEYELDSLVPYQTVDELVQQLHLQGMTVRKISASQTADWAVAYRTNNEPALVCEGGIFSVVYQKTAGVSHCSVLTELGVCRNGTQQPPLVFSVELGEDGPELVVSA